MKTIPPLAGIKEPLQVRSRETMDRIMEALEQLLREKTFDKITMIELAQRSETGISSIYARFKDKQSLILGMHMRLRTRSLACLAELTDPVRWSGKSIADIISGVIEQSSNFYVEHDSLIRAALYVNDEQVRERQASVLRTASQQLSELIIPHAPQAAQEISVALDACCLLFASVIYTGLIFGDVPIVRHNLPEDEKRRQLAVVMNALIQDAITPKAAP